MKSVFFSSNKLIPALLFILFIGVYGCSHESVTPALPGNEFLTTVQLQLTNAADPTDVHTATWTQISPYTNTFQTDSAYTNLAYLNLKANSTYNGKVIILDETQTPFDTVSNEIKQRENYHLFFFQPSPILASNVVISNTTTNIPVADWNTGLPASDTTAGGVSINEQSIAAGGTGSPLNLTVTRTDLDGNNPSLEIGLTDSFVTGAASTGILRVVLRHQPNSKNGTYPPGSSDLDVTYAVNIQ